MHKKPLYFAQVLYFLFERRSRRLAHETQPDFATRSESSQIWKLMSKIWESLHLKRVLQKLPILGGFTTTTVGKN